MQTLIMITVTTANSGQGREQSGKGTQKLADQFNDNMDEDDYYKNVDEDYGKGDNVDENSNYNVDDDENDDNSAESSRLKSSWKTRKSVAQENGTE